MRILAIESSAKAASVAVVRDDVLEAYAYQNTGLTHSRTLMPMVRDALRNADLSLDDIDLIAAANGPGSFTGLRIGVAAAKGLAWAAQKPGIGVSTLEAMARNLAHVKAVICCVMDARRGEYYNALFESDGIEPRRLCEDRTIPLEKLADILARLDTMVVLVGDGANSAFERLEQECPDITLAPPHLIHQSAYGVAMAAKAAYTQRRPADLSALDPVYIRMPQAERERLEREKEREKRGK